MRGVYARRGLNQAMEELSISDRILIEEEIERWVKEIKTDIKVNPIGMILGIYEYIDEAVQKEKIAERSTCKRGCSFCCKMNVTISEYEAIAIGDYCRKNGIGIDKAYLSRQLAYPPLEIPCSPVSACVFLKAGECSIYKVRPLACRLYNSVDDPAYCDVEKNSNHVIASNVCLWGEAMMSAFITAIRKKDEPMRRMPIRLMKYAK